MPQPLDCLTLRTTGPDRQEVLKAQPGIELPSVNWIAVDGRAGPEGWVAGWNQSTAPLVGICDPDGGDLPVVIPQLLAGRDRLASGGGLAACLPTRMEPDLPGYWDEIPAELALLCLPPAARSGGVFRRQTIEALGGLRGVSDPFWDMSLRLLEAGKECQWTAAAMSPHRPGTAGWPPLVPRGLSPQDQWLRNHLTRRLPVVASQFPAPACDRAALQAGVWQFHGELDVSHGISQRHEGEGDHQLCDYWHAIMHRREPDYGNAKYWFRQIGRQPVFAELAQCGQAVLQRAASPAAAHWSSRLVTSRGWDPFAMVDLAQAAAEDAVLDELARRLQWLEMLLLLRFTLRQCQGGQQ